MMRGGKTVVLDTKDPRCVRCDARVAVNVSGLCASCHGGQCRSCGKYAPNAQDGVCESCRQESPPFPKYAAPKPGPNKPRIDEYLLPEQP